MNIALVLAFPCLATASVQEPSLPEREALFEQYLRAPDRLRGGEIQAHWLDDGSSFWYEEDAQAMFIDPAEGVPRGATRADQAREVSKEGGSMGYRYSTRDSTRWAEVRGDLRVDGSDLGAGVQLTSDAGPEVMWGLAPGCWSSDGSMLLASRMDLGGVHQIPIVDYAKALETVDFAPYTKAGTPFARFNLAVFRVPTGARVDVDLGSAGDIYVFALGWREGDGELLFLRMNREATRLDLMAADPVTGASRVILTETQKTFVGGLDFLMGGWREFFTPVEGTDRFLWLSERSGWRQVYQYDYSAALIGQVTSGEFPVLRVAGVDPERWLAFVVANAESRVYDTHLYRVNLDGGELLRLTEGNGEHRVQLSPSRLYFVDTHSSLDRPPVSELFDAGGKPICKLAEADVSALDRLGWSPPEPFVVKAADGKTNLHGVLFKPAWFDPAQKYPVIDYIYSGPFMTIVPNEFGCGTPHARRAQAMAQLGFITFLVDPRGTTERGKAFQDASYGRIGEIEIPDHVATLRQIAEERPYMDLDHVGVYGHSWGGYFALRAMLTAPEVFHVGVAGAPGELTEAAPINEPYMRTPQNNPAGYAAGRNAHLASKLEGKLLIIHGTADVNAPFSTSMRMVAALIDAGKLFDLLVIPGGEHSFRGVQGEYESKRVRDYFLKHLRGESLWE